MLLKGYYEYYFLLLANTQPFPENHRKCVYVSNHSFSHFGAVILRQTVLVCGMILHVLTIQI